MKGPGDHLHDVVREWTGQDFRPGCGCEKWIRKMNRRGVEWCKKMTPQIVEKMRREATKRRWWSLFARMKVAARFPIREMVKEAIRRSEQGGTR